VRSSAFAAIILAGGFSSRMGCFKPLLMIDGETIVDRVISTYRQNGIEVYLVTGYQQEELLISIKDRDIHIVKNPDYNLGMFNSIQAGLRSLPSDIVSCFVAPVDIPLVRPFTIRHMMETAKENPGKIIYPELKGVRGHPTLIPMHLTPAILDWKKDGGLKALLDSWDNLALEAAVPDRFILLDIDTPEDYTMLLDSFARYRLPDRGECEVILNNIAAVSEKVYRHCTKVAEVAGNIGQAIAASFINLDLEAIESGAILHDILKGQPDHARAAGRLLSEMGFDAISEIVAAHTDLPAGVQDLSLEAKIVYLADKYVKEDTIIPLEERFQSAIERFGDNPLIKAEILKRRKKSFDVKDEIERLLRRLLEGVIFT
jgi:molybdenum cofactor cytidylyltransferase